MVLIFKWEKNQLTSSFMYIKDKVQNKDPTYPADFHEFINEVHYQATLYMYAWIIIMHFHFVQ